jgi:lipoprotein-releasing system permease protein
LYFLFAWRYFKSKKSTTAINIIAWISVLAITVGTAALIVVLSVFNGFEGLVKGLYGDFYSDLRITPVSGKYFTLQPSVQQKLNSLHLPVTYAIEEKAVITNGEYQTIVYLKGVDENYNKVSNLSKHTQRGKFLLGTAETPELVLGSGIENAIGADPELNINELTIYLPNRSNTSSNVQDAMHSYNAFAKGTFSVQQEFDNKYAFTNLSFMQYMLDLQPNQFSAIELKVSNDESVISDARENIQKLLGKDFKVQTRYEQNQSLYTVMQIEKWVVYAILCLILIVAAFNMIGALTMLVLEKQKDIAVLKAMGVNDKQVQKIFLFEGLLLAIIGGVAGTLLALIICVLQQKFKFIKLEGGTFIIDYYPVKMLAPDFLLVSLTVLVVTMLAAWFPARKAAKQEFSLKS